MSASTGRSDEFWQSLPMRFKACFSGVGVGWLLRRFLPAFEKLAHGRPLELTLLILPASVHLVYDGKAHSGPEAHADFAISELFDPEGYQCESAHGNAVGLRFDAALLRRALAGLDQSDAEKCGAAARGSQGGKAPSSSLALEDSR